MEYLRLQFSSLEANHLQPLSQVVRENHCCMDGLRSLDTKMDRLLEQVEKVVEQKAYQGQFHGGNISGRSHTHTCTVCQQERVKLDVLLLANGSMVTIAGNQ